MDSTSKSQAYLSTSLLLGTTHTVVALAFAHQQSHPWLHMGLPQWGALMDNRSFANVWRIHASYNLLLVTPCLALGISLINSQLWHCHAESQVFHCNTSLGLALGDHQSLLCRERDATLNQPSVAVTGLSLPDARWALSLATLILYAVVCYTVGCSPSRGGPGTTPDGGF